MSNRTVRSCRWESAAESSRLLGCGSGMPDPYGRSPDGPGWPRGAGRAVESGWGEARLARGARDGGKSRPPVPDPHGGRRMVRVGRVAQGVPSSRGRGEARLARGAGWSGLVGCVPVALGRQRFETGHSGFGGRGVPRPYFPVSEVVVRDAPGGACDVSRLRECWCAIPPWQSEYAIMRNCANCLGD